MNDMKQRKPGTGWIAALGGALGALLILAPLWTGGAGEYRREEEKDGAEKADPAAKDDDGAKTKAAYAGVMACKGCHPEAFRIWTGTHHARSFVSLGMEMARRISEEPGAVPGMPSMKMMKDCSPCHAMGTQIPRAERGDFHPEDGVQCESCHGSCQKHIEAASKADYKAGSEPELRTRGQEACMTCHKEKKTHEVLGLETFDYKEFWPRVAHTEKDRKGAKQETKDRY